MTCCKLNNSVIALALSPWQEKLDSDKSKNYERICLNNQNFFLNLAFRQVGEFFFKKTATWFLIGQYTCYQIFNNSIILSVFFVRDQNLRLLHVFQQDMVKNDSSILTMNTCPPAQDQWNFVRTSKFFSFYLEIYKNKF